MSEDRFGLTGSERSRTKSHDREARRGQNLRLLAVVLVVLLVTSGIAFTLVNYAPGHGKGLSSATTQSTLTWPLVLNCQHKDSNMVCVPDGPYCVPPNGAHAWNDAKGADGFYGTVDDCPHCSCYCVPACISMIAVYRGIAGIFIVQDQIYDNGKSTLGETLGDGVLQTHGVGMFDGTGGWAKEVQTSFQWSLGIVGYIEHNSSNPLTVPVLAQYIAFGYPVLWLDRDGWPANQSASYPSLTYKADLGHAKVIAGWNDSDTPLDTSDDMCLIYDPWPEYNDAGILPMDAIQGPGGTFDPYWLPLNDVLNDTNDIFLRDTFAPVPEFHGLLVPILGFMTIAVVLVRWKSKSRQEG
jgi:hypothetical protein